MNEEHKIGTHGFERRTLGIQSSCLTFSVGIFAWVKSAHGVKKSAAKVRVSGSTMDPEAVYTRAEAIVRALDAGAYHGPKTIRV